MGGRDQTRHSGFRCCGGRGEKTGKKGPIWTHPYKINSGAKNSGDLKNSGYLTPAPETLIPLLSLPPSPPVSLKVEPPGQGNAGPPTQPAPGLGHTRRSPTAALHPPRPRQGCHPDSPPRASLPTHPPSLSRCLPESCIGHLLWFPWGTPHAWYSLPHDSPGWVPLPPGMLALQQPSAHTRSATLQ